MLIKESMQQYIRKNAIATIGTDGLMGNKLVNIIPTEGSAPFVKGGDVLSSKKPLDTDEMLRVLSDTNEDIAVVAENLKKSIHRINNSTALWTLLSDETVPENIKASMVQVLNASLGVNHMVDDLKLVVTQVKEGKGPLGMVLNDTSFARNLNEALVKVKSIGEQADTLSKQINALATSIHQDVEHGEGIVHALLKDKEVTNKLNSSLENIEKGTEAFQENMEALKSNFLFRSYFRQQEKIQMANYHS
jgi:phospholipid/cholesterol/gamma-HCH transport system substrate-binding protein